MVCLQGSPIKGGADIMSQGVAYFNCLPLFCGDFQGSPAPFMQRPAKISGALRALMQKKSGRHH